MKDYYLFSSNGVPVKVSQNFPAKISLGKTEFDKDKFIKQLEDLVSYIKKYAK